MISIIIPIFNARDTLRESVDSILREDIPDQEIVLIDDGSTDDSWKLISDFQKRNSNIVAHKNSKNKGGGAARNIGVQKSKNPYLFVLDSDDVLIRGCLSKALDVLRQKRLDGLGAGENIFFRNDVNQPLRKIKHLPGLRSFKDLVSHKPNPVIGNLLFTRDAYERAGGYPEHHGFDTQGFGHRLLGNGLKIDVAEFPFYYQRLPIKPSYYVREARAGNVNRNWFYIYLEWIYKFKPDIRGWLLNYPCGDSRRLAKGLNLFHELATLADSAHIFCDKGINMVADEAYDFYDNVLDDCNIQVWCAYKDFDRGNLSKALSRIESISSCPGAVRAIYPLLSLWVNKGLVDNQIDDIRYFFLSNKSFLWKFKFYGQKFLNKINI